jgi:hypothetical protein
MRIETSLPTQTNSNLCSISHFRLVRVDCLFLWRAAVYFLEGFGEMKSIEQAVVGCFSTICIIVSRRKSHNY